MVLSVMKAATAGYYSQRTGLEARRDLADGVWFNPDGLFGIADGAAVEPGQLKLLLDDKRPDTGQGANRLKTRTRSGKDFVFSAPKSVSLAWALGDQETRCVIEAAMLDAVRSALRLLHDQATCERVKKGGKELRPAKTAAILFIHIVSRRSAHQGGAQFPDPNIHIHAVVPEFVVNSGGQVKCAYTTMWNHWLAAIGTWFRATLARRILEAGFDVVASETRPAFQIRGVQKEWMRQFSARTVGPKGLSGKKPKRVVVKEVSQAELEALRAEHGLHSVISADHLEAKWAEHAQAHDVAMRAILAAATERRRTKSASSRTGQRLTEPMAERFLGKAAARLSQTNAVMRLPDLAQAFAYECILRSTAIAPEWVFFEKAINSPSDLVELKATQSYGLQQWATQNTLDDENDTIANAKELLKGQFRAATVSQRAEKPLNDGQLAAAELAASAAMLVLIEGPAGSGKTELLGQIIGAYRKQHPSVKFIGASVAWLTAIALQNRFDIESYALAKLFQLSRRNGVTVDENTIIIVDEVGLIGTRDMRALVVLAARSKAKLIFVGDGNQLDPIAAGSGLQLLKRASGLPQASLTDLVRQEESTQKSAVERFIRGDMKGVFDVMTRAKRWSIYADSKPAYERVVKELASQYIAASGGLPEAIGIVKSNAEVYDICRRIRILLREAGLLTGPDILVPAVTPSGQPMRLALAVGDHIRFLARNDQLNVYNGTEAIIRRIDFRSAEDIEIQADVREANVQEADRRPRAVKFHPRDFWDAKQRVRIAPGYARTVYGVQGLTVDRTIVIATASWNYSEFYVALTRARHHCQIVDLGVRKSADIDTALSQRAKRARSTRRLLRAQKRAKSKSLALDHACGP